jgi:ABC-2 type transport system ATP-binding protein
VNEGPILTENLCKSFGTLTAVRDLKLRVAPGAVYGFLGRNGAGKTTTMRVLLGLMHPTSGHARVCGLDPARERTRVQILQRVAYLPQRKQLYSPMTVQELVRCNRGFFPRWSNELAAHTAKALDIPMRTPFGKLSIGNQTKVALLLALAQNAEVLILDEPTSGLDPLMVDELLRLLIEDHVSQGRTIFVSSHQLAEVEQICDWVGILEQGRLLLEARLEDIRNDFRLVTACGESLPRMPLPNVVSEKFDGRFSTYVVSRDAEAFVAQLRNQGATILETVPLGLRDLFLYLVRKEDPCTPGNVGEKPAPVSSFS